MSKEKSLDAKKYYQRNSGFLSYIPSKKNSLRFELVIHSIAIISLIKSYQHKKENKVLMSHAVIIKMFKDDKNYNTHKNIKMIDS